MVSGFSEGDEQRGNTAAVVFWLFLLEDVFWLPLRGLCLSWPWQYCSYRSKDEGRPDCEACCLVHQERMVVSVSFEDSCLKQLPTSATPRAKWLFTGCWANQVLPHLLCCSALQGGVETTDPASGCTCYRETGTYGQEACAGSRCCSVQHPLHKCCWNTALLSHHVAVTPCCCHTWHSVQSRLAGCSKLYQGSLATEDQSS